MNRRPCSVCQEMVKRFEGQRCSECYAALCGENACRGMHDAECCRACQNTGCGVCLDRPCAVCEHSYGDHWATNKGDYEGCSGLVYDGADCMCDGFCW